ncbi:transmembrane protein 181-like isoform X3 [Apostichopus japonicus]|uniref:transmembrane protein 181-like isoform X3 n=1 Tax=Stichopus japonicus TaxID=307972 RepID=UPI003AB5F17A
MKMKKSFNIDSSVQMRLYTLTKRQFVLVFICFFAAFGVSVLIGITGPSIDVSFSTVRSNANTNDSFSLESPTLNKFNRSLWLTAVINSTDYKKDKFQSDLAVTVSIRGAKDDASVEKVGQQEYNHDRSLICSKKSGCQPILLAHVGVLEYAKYHFVITLAGLENNPADSISFCFRSYNPIFSNMEIWFRFIFLVLTFIVTCMFAHALRKFSIRDWSIEQKWLSVLLPLLLLYNNPIFPLIFLVNSWVPLIVDNIFQTTFLSALLLFWLCTYHGIRQSDRKWMKFYLPKAIIVGAMWIIGITMTCWQQYRGLYDPTFNYKVDSGNFVALITIFFIFGGLYLLYLLFLVIRAFTELRSLPYMNLRLQFMTILMLCVVIASTIITILRFGVSIIKENFVSELSTYYKNSAEFLAFYSLLNLYLYTMAFVYSPSKNAYKDSYFKDNPTFAMLNESEDDMGSEDEEDQRTSLTSTRYQDSDNE